MKSVNQVTLLGNLTRDPVLKYTPQGTAVINFSIATSRSYKDKQTDGWKEISEFTNVVFWGKSAEIIGQYCNKGSKLFVQGRLQTRSWDDKETGTKRYTTEVIGSDFTLLGEKQGATSKQAEDIFNPKEEKEEEIIVPDEDLESLGGQDEMPF